MKTICLLENPIQDYAWGSTTKIQSLMGVEDQGKPMAEMWMGAHPKAPSRVLIDGKWQSLDVIIRENPESILGKRVAEKFSNQLPFLFKVLAAERPLSAQVHPNREQAQEGYRKENALGIPLNAPNRNYRDTNHKPEILCALTPFQGLQGFRNIEEMLALMDGLSLSTISNELDLLRQEPDSHGLKVFFSSLMAMDQTRQKDIAHEAADVAAEKVREDKAFQWITELNKEYPGDIGILLPLMLNLFQLEPGEAVYLPAGALHAYLDGFGIELMANSDNVLRGGLTPKHIDVPELLKIVTFDTGPVRKVTTSNRGGCQTVFQIPASEFVLSMISVDDDRSFTRDGYEGVEILICFIGKATIEDLDRNEGLSVSQGQSFIVPSAVSRYRIHGNAALYMASVPL